ncbi:hypothetical protein [Streptomyces syringium]|uniref:hypothetical protein n=1 Tax=Streptomyces syringium TaxID=76729 RepID=UPI0033F20902
MLRRVMNASTGAPASAAICLRRAATKHAPSIRDGLAELILDPGDDPPYRVPLLARRFPICL